MTEKIFPLPRSPQDFTQEEVESFRKAGLANDYFENPLIPDIEVRESMAIQETLANDQELQALFIAVKSSQN